MQYRVSQQRVGQDDLFWSSEGRGLSETVAVISHALFANKRASVAQKKGSVACAACLLAIAMADKVPLSKYSECRVAKNPTGWRFGLWKRSSLRSGRFLVWYNHTPYCLANGFRCDFSILVDSRSGVGRCPRVYILSPPPILFLFLSFLFQVT